MQNPRGSSSLSSSTTSTFFHYFITASLNTVGRIFEQKAKINILKKKKKRFPSRVLEIYNIWECSWFKKIAVVFPSWKKSTTMPRLQ